MIELAILNVQAPLCWSAWYLETRYRLLLLEPLERKNSKSFHVSLYYLCAIWQIAFMLFRILLEI